MTSVPYAEVIGDPIAHSKSPLIHKFWLAKLGIDGDYRKTHLPAAGLGDFFAARRLDMNWRGCNVTIPHKQAVMPFLDRLDISAGAVGAVNTVVRVDTGLVGYNSDVEGIADAIGDRLSSGARVCLIGAGGAALAAVALLERHDVKRVDFVVRDPDRARPLVDRLSGATAWTFDRFGDASAGADILINASPLGMTGKPALPATCLGLERLAPGAMIFDMVYDPLETALLQAARRSGLATADGLVMLIGQAAAAFHLFFGQPAPREHDAQLRALLIA